MAMILLVSPSCKSVSYHPALDYRSVYSVAAQVGIGIGVEYCRFTLAMHLDGTADNIISVKNQLVKKQDLLSRDL